MRIINLLPKPKQQELYYENLFHSVMVGIQFAVVTFVLVFLGQLGTKFYLLRQSTDLDSQITQIKQQTNKEENTKLKEQVGLINNRILDFSNLADATPYWSKVLRAFAGNVPAGVRITGFNADLTKKKIDIQGYSPTRELVIALYNNINADSADFSNINYPLENVAKENNVLFHFTFSINNSLLK